MFPFSCGLTVCCLRRPSAGPFITKTGARGQQRNAFLCQKRREKATPTNNQETSSSRLPPPSSHPPPFRPSILLPFPGGRDSGWKGKKEQGHCIDGGEPVLEAGGDAWVVAMPLPPPFFRVHDMYTTPPPPPFIFMEAGRRRVSSVPSIFFTRARFIGGWLDGAFSLVVCL